MSQNRAAAWIDEKSLNFLNFLKDLMGRYTVPEDIKKQIGGYVDELLENRPKRDLIFSVQVRSRVASVPSVSTVVSRSRVLFDSEREEKERLVDEALDNASSIIKMMAEFIEELRKNKDVLINDINKLAGYLQIFYGAFVSSCAPPSVVPQISSSSDS